MFRLFRLSSSGIASRVSLALAIASCLISSVSADVETTASIRGNVGVAGANVTATHIPTGLQKTTEVGASGNYVLYFLPIGGPYTVKVEAEGYQDQLITDVFLSADKRRDLNFAISKELMEETTVTAERIVGSDDVGPSTILNRDQIDAIATINRSIADYVRLDPRVTINSANSRSTEISVMGANNRFNDFMIDGISQNDPFGLNANGFGTMRNPIDMEFVDQISVDIAPFDTSRGNTSAGSILTVTKRGTNDYHGSVYYNSFTEANVGQDANGNEFPEFEETDMSGWISGPIVKDRLFFFAGYSSFESAEPALYGTKDSGAVNSAEVVTTAMADQIKNIASSVYGYEAGDISNVSFPEEQTEYRVKLDANLSDRHRGQVQYSKVESLLPRRYNRGNTVFSNNYYVKPPIIDTMSVTLWSDLTERLSTKIRWSSYEMEEDDSSIGDGLFPEVNIEVSDEDGNSDNVYLGGDRYRGANHIMVDRQRLNLKAEYNLDSHLIKGGLDFEDGSTYNLFIARYNGEVHFDSISDFESGQWSYLRFHIPLAGIDKPETAAANFDVEKMTAYLQDTWYVTPDLSLMFGVRYVETSTPSEPVLNPNFLARNGVPNNSKFEFKKVNPRFSFDLDAKNTMFAESDSIIAGRLRGGVGSFLGRIPDVWYGNAYSRSGGLTDYNRFRSFSDTIGVMPAASVADPRFFWVGPTSDYTVRSAYFGDAQGTDPNFQPPTIWRGSLGLDLSLVTGTDLTFEWVQDETRQAPFYQDLGLIQTGVLADGRGVYDGAEDYWLTNTGKGNARSLSFTLNQSFDDVMGGSMAIYFGYANTEKNSVYSATSSQAGSNYNYMPRYDGENLPAARSNWMAEHKFVSSIDFKADWFGDNESRISLVFVRKSGEPYSVMYDDVGYNAINGGAFYSDNALAYIPSSADDPAVAFSSPEAAATVMTYINNSELSEYKGQVAPRNAFTSRWFSRLDLRLTQEINIPNLDGHKAKIFFDIQNLLNMLDDENGQVWEYSYNNSRKIINGGVNDDGQVIITGVDTDDNWSYRNNDRQSVWQVKLGLKYEF